MNRLRLYGAVAMSVGVLSFSAAPAVWAQDTSKGDAANGRKVYLADGCYQCHGRVGQGGLMTGAAPILRIAQEGLDRAVATKCGTEPE